MSTKNRIVRDEVDNPVYGCTGLLWDLTGSSAGVPSSSCGYWCSIEHGKNSNPRFMTLCSNEQEYLKGIATCNAADIIFGSTSHEVVVGSTKLHDLDALQIATTSKSIKEYLNSVIANDEFLQQKKLFPEIFENQEFGFGLAYSMGLIEVLKLDFNSIRVTVSDYPSVIFRTKDSRGYELSYEVFIPSDEEDDFSVVFSLYLQGTLILRDSSSVEDSIKKISESIVPEQTVKGIYSYGTGIVGLGA